MPIDLAALVARAVARAAVRAHPDAASHAEVARELQPVVEQVLALGRPAALDAFRACGMIPGTWVQHVLAECKSAWSLADTSE